MLQDIKSIRVNLAKVMLNKNALDVDKARAILTAVQKLYELEKEIENG